jgi:hypothetical protein
LPKSVTRTLRVEEELDRAIAKRASKEGVSFNFLATRSLRKFIEWDVPIVELGMVVVPSLVLDRLASGKGEKELEEYGREVARDLIKPATVYVTGEFTVASAIEVMRRSSQYSGRFSFDFDDGLDSRNQVLIVRHEHGRVWSSYFAGLLDETFRVLLGKDVKVEFTDSLCIVQLSRSAR